MYNTVFFILISIIIFSYLLERILGWLNIKSMRNTLPDGLTDVYDAGEYARQQEYQKVNSKFGILTSTFSFLLTMGMLLSGGFAYVDNLARDLTAHPILLPLFFFGILMFASDLFNTPFSIYDTFVIEQKFGFNKTTPKTFVLDKIKSWLLSAIIGGGILGLVVYIYHQTTDMFWIFTWAVISAFTIFMSMFYSNIIVPLFNKQTPLEEGELKTAINEFASKVGFKLNNIYTIDGSKRSTKANAYFTGLGAKKRIVLYDTLINDLSTQEIVAVLAHEIGHYKKKHTLQGIIISVLQTGLTLYILSLLIANPALSEALGSSKPSFHLGLLAFGILYSPISLIIGLAMNVLSRKNEYQADYFAGKHYDATYLISSLKKLSKNNLSNLTPHPIFVFFYYSHPTLLQRIKAMKQNHAKSN